MIWSEFLLDEVATVFNGKTPSKLEQRNDGYPVLKIKDVSERGKFKGRFESFVDVEVANKSKLKLIHFKDTLILNAAHNADYVGSKQYCAEQEVVGSLPTGEWLIIRGKNNKVDPTYLNFWFRLESTKFNIRNMVKGIHLYPKDVARLKVPLPPLTEQQKIAAILDAADSLRQKDQQLVERYTALSQSLFLEMFGDPVTNPMGWDKPKLGSLVKIERGGSPRPIDEFLGGTYPWIKIGDATKDNEIYLERTKEHIIESGLRKTRLLPAGSIIFANCGVSLGFARIITFSGCIHDGWLSFSEINEDVLNKIFILKTLNSITNYFRSSAPEGTQPNLNTSIMKSFEFIHPPIDLQNQFAERIQLIEAQKQQAQRSLEKSEALFNSLLQRAFTGELTAKMAP